MGMSGQIPALGTVHKVQCHQQKEICHQFTVDPPSKRNRLFVEIICTLYALLATGSHRFVISSVHQ